MSQQKLLKLVVETLDNAGTVSLAGDTAWKEFLISYSTYAGENWITAARGETQQYYCKEHVDLYEFCRNLIDSES